VTQTHGHDLSYALDSTNPLASIVGVVCRAPLPSLRAPKQTDRRSRPPLYVNINDRVALHRHTPFPKVQFNPTRAESSCRERPASLTQFVPPIYTSVAAPRWTHRSPGLHVLGVRAARQSCDRLHVGSKSNLECRHSTAHRERRAIHEEPGHCVSRVPRGPAVAKPSVSPRP
jgi:hypothetical protein